MTSLGSQPADLFILKIKIQCELNLFLRRQNLSNKLK